jgi:hypothetical protein
MLPPKSTLQMRNKNKGTQFQAPNSKYIPMNEIQNSRLHPLLELGDLNLDFGIWLGFVAWCLVPGI